MKKIPLMHIVLLILIGFTIGLFFNIPTFTRKSNPHIQIRSSLKSMVQAIELYQMECGEYPYKLSNLINKPKDNSCSSFPKGGFIKKRSIPNDPWGNPFNYKKTSEHSYELSSTGVIKDYINDDISLEFKTVNNKKVFYLKFGEDFKQL